MSRSKNKMKSSDMYEDSSPPQNRQHSADTQSKVSDLLDKYIKKFPSQSKSELLRGLENLVDEENSIKRIDQYREQTTAVINKEIQSLEQQLHRQQLSLTQNQIDVPSLSKNVIMKSIDDGKIQISIIQASIESAIKQKYKQNHGTEISFLEEELEDCLRIKEKLSEEVKQKQKQAKMGRDALSAQLKLVSSLQQQHQEKEHLLLSLKKQCKRVETWTANHSKQRKMIQKEEDKEIGIQFSLEQQIDLFRIENSNLQKMTEREKSRLGRTQKKNNGECQSAGKSTSKQIGVSTEQSQSSSIEQKVEENTKLRESCRTLQIELQTMRKYHHHAKIQKQHKLERIRNTIKELTLESSKASNPLETVQYQKSQGYSKLDKQQRMCQSVQFSEPCQIVEKPRNMSKSSGKVKKKSKNGDRKREKSIVKQCVQFQPNWFRQLKQNSVQSFKEWARELHIDNPVTVLKNLSILCIVGMLVFCSCSKLDSVTFG